MNIILMKMIVKNFFFRFNLTVLLFGFLWGGGGGGVIIIMNNIHCFQSQHSRSMMKREININWVLINIFTVSTNMRIN